MRHLKSKLARRARILWRRYAARRASSELKSTQRRIATLAGAIAPGLIALGFANLADHAQLLFTWTVVRAPYLPLVLTPAVFAAIVWFTRNHAPDAAGSGIPQVIAAGRTRNRELGLRLVSMATAIKKLALTLAMLLVGASVGREGPTVQVSAAVMVWTHRLLRVPITTGVLIAGGAAGVIGGALGGGFSRVVLGVLSAERGPVAIVKRRPIAFAAGCGLVVAALGIVTGGETWGTGYAATRDLVEGHGLSGWFGPAKLIATLATTLSGAPGGIFAPSLATGAGIGNLFAPLFPDQPAGAIVVLGMVAYFVGVVRAPFTAVIIVSEATAGRGMILPMFATALIADWVSGAVCRERLYHGLSQRFLGGKGSAQATAKGD